MKLRGQLETSTQQLFQLENQDKDALQEGFDKLEQDFIVLNVLGPAICRYDFACLDLPH